MIGMQKHIRRKTRQTRTDKYFMERTWDEFLEWESWIAIGNRDKAEQFADDVELNNFDYNFLTQKICRHHWKENKGQFFDIEFKEIKDRSYEESMECYVKCHRTGQKMREMSFKLINRDKTKEGTLIAMAVLNQFCQGFFMRLRLQAA